MESSILCLLLLDVASDPFRISSHCIDEKPSRPQVLPSVIAFPFQYMPRHVDRTLALQIPHYARHRQLRRNAHQHVHVIWQYMPLFYHAVFLFGQTPEYRPQLPPHHSEKASPSVFRDKYDMVFALPFCMTLASVVLHGFCVLCALVGSLHPFPGGLHDKSNSESLPGIAGGGSYCSLRSFHALNFLNCHSRALPRQSGMNSNADKPTGRHHGSKQKRHAIVPAHVLNEHS